MNGKMTRSAARNIFFFGSLFFLIVLLTLTIRTHLYILNSSTGTEGSTVSIKRNNQVWEKNSCIDCDYILGEGDYSDPEPDNGWRSSRPDLELNAQEDRRLAHPTDVMILTRGGGVSSEL